MYNSVCINITAKEFKMTFISRTLKGCYRQMNEHTCRIKTAHIVLANNAIQYKHRKSGDWIQKCQ